MNCHDGILDLASRAKYAAMTPTIPIMLSDPTQAQY